MFKNKFIWFIGIMMFFGGIGFTTIVGCGPRDKNTDEKVSAAQEEMNREANAQTGLPSITNFTEKKLLKYLYELRDKPHVITYTYIPDMNGKLWHVCDSIGYAIPYATQYSNPQKRVFTTVDNSAHSDYDSPQAEPNGLFMPPSAEGSWVNCINSAKPSEIAPMYIEPRVIVSSFKLRAEGEYSGGK